MIKVIKFYTSSCVPCKRLTPILNELKQELNFELNEINLDNGIPEEFQQFNIMSTPTILIYKDNEIKKQIIGLRSQETYKNYIKELL